MKAAKSSDNRGEKLKEWMTLKVILLINPINAN